mmetsp:Transcript_5371/g.9442  ORF Transcript_5371/g.9442 Transcript_5371/m.9442 type:complete len:89 (-) Transcript_5371:936-1202(-)
MHFDWSKEIYCTVFDWIGFRYCWIEFDDWLMVGFRDNSLDAWCFETLEMQNVRQYMLYGAFRVMLYTKLFSMEFDLLLRLTLTGVLVT